MSAARRKLTKNFIKSELKQFDIHSSIIRRWWYWRSLVLVDPWYWYFKPRRQTCRANDTNFSTSLSGSVLRLCCVPFTFPATLVFSSLFTLSSLYSFSVNIELSFGCSVAMNFCILCGCNFEIYWIVMKCLSFVRHKITSSIFINGSKQKDIKLLFAFKLKCKNWNSKVRLRFINLFETQSKVRRYFIEIIADKNLQSMTSTQLASLNMVTSLLIICLLNFQTWLTTFAELPKEKV